MSLPPPQFGPALEELRPRRRDDEQRDVGHPVDELVDEVEQALVRPVEVLEDEDERALLGEPFEEAPPRGERLVAPVAAELAPRPPRPTSARRCVSTHALVAGTRERVLDGADGSSPRSRRRVLLEDARLRLDDLAERPQRDAVAVGEAAALAPRDELRVGVDDPGELVDEAALADARDADERHELRRALVARALERISEDAELALAADELGARLVRDVDAEAGARSDRLPDGDRLGLPLRLDRRRVVVVDACAGRAVRRLVDEDPVDRSGALQARGRVDDVARGHALAGLRVARRGGRAPRRW